jgi:hypothetical protein
MCLHACNLIVQVSVVKDRSTFFEMCDGQRQAQARKSGREGTTEATSSTYDVSYTYQHFPLTNVFRLYIDSGRVRMHIVASGCLPTGTHLGHLPCGYVATTVHVYVYIMAT